MIQVENLVKTFRPPRGRPVHALDGVSFAAEEGEIFGLLGRNGAGKTTTLRILATILAPTGGRARVLGHDVVAEGDAVRSNIGFLTGDTRLYDRLTGRETLAYFGRLQGMSRAARHDRIDALAPRFGLEPFLDRRVGTLSTGQRQRLSLARALLHDPPVLILDEPTTGLDVLAARETVQLVRSLRGAGRVVLLSTHILSEVEKLCDRVAIVERGRVLTCESVAAVAARAGGDLEAAFVSLVLETGPPEEASEQIAASRPTR